MPDPAPFARGSDRASKTSSTLHHRHRALFALLIGAMLPSAAARAQAVGADIGAYGGYGAGIYAGGEGYGASTVYGSRARGLADIIRARSQAMMDAAAAATQFEEAREEYITNRTYATKQFLARRVLRQQYHEEQVQADRERLAEYLASRELQPLTSSEFYPGTGEISWPLLLADPAAEKGRKRIEELFAKRAKEGELSATERAEASKLLAEWRNSLPLRYTDSESVSRSEITEAARFLNRLNAMLENGLES